MSARIYRILFILILFISCSDEQDDENIFNTDLSVTSITERIIYQDIEDLELKLNSALSFNYGNASDNEIEIMKDYNQSITRVVVSINFKDEFASLYNDQNLSNNIVVIDLEESIDINLENSNGINDFSIGSDPWISCNITFSFFGFSPDLSEQDQEQLFAEACQVWADEISGLDFINLGNENINALLRVDFSQTSSHPPCPEPFNNNIIAHAFYPTIPNFLDPALAGDIHFNDQYNYTSSELVLTEIDFKSIAIHEIGHSLGIGHSEFEESVMYPSYSTGTIKHILSQDDVNAINLLYSENCSNGTSSNISLSGNLNFGDVEVNQTSTRTLTISNIGSSDFNVTSITNPVGFSSNFNGLVSAGDSVEVIVTFQPTNEQEYSGNITVNSTADSGDETISVSGSGINNQTNESIIELSGNLNFGDVEVNQSATRTLTISNIGTSDFEVSNISNPSGFSSSFNGTVTAGNSVSVTVTFQPTNEQNYSGNITVNSTADSGDETISVSGSGINNQTNESIIELSGNLNFGEVEVNQSATRTLTISNIGTSDFDVSNISNPSGFSSSFSGTVTAGNSVGVTVTFQPTNEQNYNGIIIVNSNADSGINQINCFGNGIDNNPQGTLEVINNNNFQMHFRIKKQSDNEYSSEYQITIPGGQTAYYYNLDIGIYNYEYDNSTFFTPNSIYFSNGQVNITSGSQSTITITN